MMVDMIDEQIECSVHSISRHRNPLSQPRMETIDSAQTRVIIRACVTDIPGEIGRRPNTLGQIFCSEVLHRNFNKDIKLSGFDSMHIPPGFESRQPIKRWFVCDFNVVSELRKEELLAIPHLVYHASLISGRW